MVDISFDDEARDYVMALGHLQAPVVVAGESHWSGFRGPHQGAQRRSGLTATRDIGKGAAGWQRPFSMC